MKRTSPQSENKKLFVIYRVEAGCLGPKGNKYIADFCNYAQSKLSSLDSAYITLSIVPRDNKKLPEMQCTLAGKRISHAQAEKYLARYHKVPDGFDDNFADKLETLIGDFLGHRSGET